MTSILDKIALSKRSEVALAKKISPLSDLKRANNEIRDFVAALDKNISIIAEIKKASPSKGIIRDDFDVATIAEIYEQHGAACLSVLTDADFFQGDKNYISIAKKHSKLPVLRKDFIIDSYQIDESYALGADCILLIAAILDDKQLMDFCLQAAKLGMAVLVEVHSEEELLRALKLPTPLIGINNRNLHSFVTDISTSITLSKNIPSDKIIVTESGINSHEDIQRLKDAGINCFLIGESLMREEDIGGKLLEFLS